MSVVVGGDLWIVPVGYLVGEDLCDRLAGQPQIADLLAVVADLVGERGASGRDRQVRVRPTLRRVGHPCDLIDTLIADRGHGEVGGARREVLPTLRVTVGRVHDLNALRGDVGHPLIDGIGRPARAGSFYERRAAGAGGGRRLAGEQSRQSRRGHHKPETEPPVEQPHLEATLLPEMRRIATNRTSTIASKTLAAPKARSTASGSPVR